MDRRREPRIHAYETVMLTVLGEAGYSSPANAIQLSAHGMRVVLDRPVAVNAAIKVVANDWMGLGEVCYCRQERSHYVVGFELDQALVGLEELTTLSRDFSEDQDLSFHEPEKFIA